MVWWNYLLILGLGVVMVLGSILITYLVARYKIAKEIPNAIENAEELKEAGVRKLEYAVDNLYDYLPKFCKMFISKALIKKLVQTAFEHIEKYAKKQIEKAEAKAAIDAE